MDAARAEVRQRTESFDYERTPEEGSPLDEPVLREAVRGVIEDWNATVGTIRGLGEALANAQVEPCAPRLPSCNPALHGLFAEPPSLQTCYDVPFNP